MYTVSPLLSLGIKQRLRKLNNFPKLIQPADSGCALHHRQYSCSYNVSIPVPTSRPAVVGFVLFCLCINSKNGLFNFIGPIILLPFQLTAILLWLFLQIKLLTCVVLFSSQWLSFKLKLLTVTGEMVPSLYFVTSGCLIHLFLLGMYPIPSPTERNIGHKLGWVLSDVLV